LYIVALAMVGVGVPAFVSASAVSPVIPASIAPAAAATRTPAPRPVTRSAAPPGFGELLTVGGVLLAAVVVGSLVAGRRRRWRDGIPVAANAPRRGAPDPIVESAVRLEPRLRELDLGEEAKIPRWLRPSVRAERFSVEHTRVRASGGAPAGAFEPEVANPTVDLDALFGARGTKPTKASSTKRRVPRNRARTLPD